MKSHIPTNETTLLEHYGSHRNKGRILVVHTDELGFYAMIYVGQNLLGHKAHATYPTGTMKSSCSPPCKVS